MGKFEVTAGGSRKETTKEKALNYYEVDKKVNLELLVSKSNEFDSVSSHLAAEILKDDYANITVEDDSPFPEVRAAVPSTDDFSMPQNTIRAWVIGMTLTTLGAGMNMLFGLHSPVFSLRSIVTSLLAWPIGKFWEKVVPDVKIFGARLNPGPFNIKEHTIITIMANVSFNYGVAYATDILLVQKKFYNSDFGWLFAILAVWSTQCIGFSFGGITRRILVYPSGAIWPANLVTTTFLSNMHINENHPANGWKISRLKFFAIVMGVGFLYYWLPSILFQGLSYFSWITWIKPNNAMINQLFGSTSGLGLFPNCIALDWNQIAGYIGSPLIPPAGAIACVFLSIVVIFWIIVPALHYSNVWYAHYLPISWEDSFDRFQKSYNVSRIIDPKTLSFNSQAYKEYSPLFLPTTFAIAYGLSFASVMSAFSHTALFHGREIWDQVRMKQKPDVHCRLMKQYKEVPDWWFVIVFLIFLGMSIAAIRAWPTEMPVWSLFLALCMAIVFLVPVGIILAKTNILVGLNVITEFVIGYIVPGKPLAMMFFKTFGFITNNQAVIFVQDMKLGHYMKIAPRVLFWAQFIATMWAGVVQVAVLRWSYGAIDNLCDPDQKDKYTCPNARVFFNASIIWGVIGPQRQFSPGQIYYGLLFFFIIGLLLPVINWLILKKWPYSPVRYLHWPVFFSGTGYIPPATPYNYASFCVVGLTFGWWIKKKWFHWWAKYNYSLSAGLDIGLAWGILIVFFAVGLSGTQAPKWWGNNVVGSTLDTSADNNIYITLSEGEAFGPTSW